MTRYVYHVLSIFVVFLTLILSMQFEGLMAWASTTNSSQSGSPTAPECGAWTMISSGIGGNLTGVTAISSTNVWAVGTAFGSNGPGQTLTMQWNGSQWSVVPSPNSGQLTNQLWGVAAISANDIWTVGDYFSSSYNTYQTLTEQWNGSQWTIIPSPNVGSLYTILQAVASIPNSNSLWAVGSYIINSASESGIEPIIEQWNGSQWNIFPSPKVVQGVLYGVTASSASNAWAVGWQAVNHNIQVLIEHWNGTKWSVFPSPDPSNSAQLAGVASVPNAGKMWTVGSYYNAQTGNNETLTEQYSGRKGTNIPGANPGSENVLSSITAISSSDIWAVGYYQQNSTSVQLTLTEYWDGSSWSVIPSPNFQNWNNNLTSVTSVPGSAGLWAVGGSVSPGENSQSQILIEFC